MERAGSGGAGWEKFWSDTVSQERVAVQLDRDALQAAYSECYFGGGGMADE
jgi:hypothetical protein